jgi:hypothetical protein
MLADAREAGDEARLGRLLLDLAYIVKWVRSDNQEPPFERSHTLAIEALGILGRVGDRSGQISALLLAAPFEPKEAAGRMLREADELAGELGTDVEVARVRLAQARSLALMNQDASKQLNHEALELFRRAGHSGGMASCLFALSITNGKTPEKRSYALEAARLHREAGNRDDAGRAVMVALMYSVGQGEIAALEPQIMGVLEDAQAAENRHMEACCYGCLAKIAEANGDLPEAAKYLRWQAELEGSDGLSPHERWKQNLDMTRTLVATAKRMGNLEMVRSFQAELKRLRRKKP